MDQRHTEYVEYYRARLAKYENNPLYPNLEAAERALFDAISTAATLEEFRERQAQGNLALKCAIARVRDMETAEANLYTELQETVRAAPNLEVLRRLDETAFDNVQDLVSMVSEVHVKWQLEITRDEMLRSEFWNDWKIMEDIECDQQAAVPEDWHDERRRSVASELERCATFWREHTIPEFKKFVPDFAPDWNKLLETRHRRLAPLADDIVTEKIAAHKRLVGVE